MRVSLLAFAAALLLASCFSPDNSSNNNSTVSGNGPKVAFYFIAHQDDWELFMNPNAYDDTVQETRKVVFVYLTAGDSGNKDGPLSSPYYKARNVGAKRATRFMADNHSYSRAATSTGTLANNHSIESYVYKNTVSYFLNLPDGNFAGAGYAATGQTSLQRLYLGEISQITAVDGSATYDGWADLVATLEAIVRGELVGVDARGVFVNALDPDTVVNPRDHSDHVHTGWAVLNLARRFPELGVRLFQGYSSSKLPPNVTSEELVNEAGVFAVSVSGLSDAGHAGTWDVNHKAWLGRNYWRTFREPVAISPQRATD